MPTLPALVDVRSLKFGTVPTVTALPGVASPSTYYCAKLNASPEVAWVAEGKVTAGTPFVTEPNPPRVAAEFESTVVILFPLML